VPFSTGCAANRGVAVRIGARSEENAKSTRRSGRVGEGKVNEAGQRRPPLPIGRFGAPSTLSSARPVRRSRVPFHPFATPSPVMTLFGIQLRKPSFNEITAATVMAVGIWVAVIGLAKATGQALQASDAGALLVVSVWGCLGARLGVALGKGGRHLAAHVGINAVLLVIYQGAVVLAS